ncbi:unnamed protein product [Cyclocybe aegerita]|uniref:Uncharacterized protein n=1 Tax=Cyclocybe aegerita TaxID=1973307 RepID=A0A8S0VQ66_CYCAE|nr:unnamed protein product [Cyclocybe aegerita]
MADAEGHQPRRYFHPSQYIGVSAVHVFTTGRRTPTKLEKIPMVARVALIDYRGNVVLDTFVRPTPLRKRLKSEYAVELPVLVKVFMGRNVGLGFEDPVELSRAAMDLFRSCEEVFEEEVASRGWPCDLPPERFASYFS